MWSVKVPKISLCPRIPTDIHLSFSGKLTYYKGSEMKEVKGEVVVNKHSKIEALPDYKKSFRSLQAVFKVTNAPYLEIELSAPTDQVSRRPEMKTNVAKLFLTCSNTCTRVSDWNRKANDLVVRLEKERFGTKMFGCTVVTLRLHISDFNPLLFRQQEKKSWMTAIRDIVEAARANTTPVTALLQERGAASAGKVRLPPFQQNPPSSRSHQASKNIK